MLVHIKSKVLFHSQNGLFLIIRSYNCIENIVCTCIGFGMPNNHIFHCNNF